MGDSPRIVKLRSLAAELERSAPSRERATLLREIRARIVELEIGDDTSHAWARREEPGSAGWDRPGQPILWLP